MHSDEPELVLTTEVIEVRAPTGLEFGEIFDNDVENSKSVEQEEREARGDVPRTPSQPTVGHLEVVLVTNDGGAMNAGVRLGDKLTHINGSAVTVSLEKGVHCPGAWKVTRDQTSPSKEKTRFARMPLMAALTVLKSAKVNLSLQFTLEGLRPKPPPPPPPPQPPPKKKPPPPVPSTTSDTRAPPSKVFGGEPGNSSGAGGKVVMDLAMLSAMQSSPGAFGPRPEPMILKCNLVKPFGIAYRADPVSASAVVAEVKGLMAKESGVLPKMRLLEIEGRRMDQLVVEDAMLEVQRFPTGVSLACYFDLRAEDGTVMVDKEHIPRGAEFVFKAPSASSNTSARSSPVPGTPDGWAVDEVEMKTVVLRKPFGLSFEEAEGKPLVVGVHSRQAREAGIQKHSVLMQLEDISLIDLSYEDALRQVQSLPSGVGIQLVFGPLLSAGAEMF